MDNLTSRLTEKGQTTVPKPVREALNLAAEDSIAYRMRSNAVILSKVTAGDLDWNHSVETTLLTTNYEPGTAVNVPFPFIDRPV